MNFEGKLVGTDLKVAIVVSRFNDFITNRLLDGQKIHLFVMVWKIVI